MILSEWHLTAAATGSGGPAEEKAWNTAFPNAAMFS
jgi:hypothetical protein